MLINDPHSLRRHPGLLHHAYAFIGGGDVAAPRPRNLTTELTQTLQGYQDTAGGYLDLNKMYQPQYGQLNLTNLAQQQEGYTDEAGVYHQGTLGLGAEANSFNRLSSLSDLSALGPATAGGILQANPYLSNALGNANQLAGTLTGQANDALAQGGALSQAEIRDLSQQSQSGFASRGMAQGNQSMAADLLSRDAASRARATQAQTFATGVAGLNNNLAGTASETLTNPAMQLLGLGNLTSGTNGSPNGTGTAIGNAQTLFDPMNPYAADVYNTNTNATSAANIANANNSAATTSGYLGILAALLSDERVKKDIKKVGKSPSGLPEIEWTYRTDKKKVRYHGTSAQALEKIAPYAVLEEPISGLKAVDYSKIDVPFYALNPYERKAA